MVHGQALTQDGPGYRNKPAAVKLGQPNAAFVDIIHTSIRGRRRFATLLRRRVIIRYSCSVPRLSTNTVVWRQMQVLLL